MAQSVFIFSAQGVATQATRFHAGARHALMLFGKGPDMASARVVAIAGAEHKGWRFVDVRREKEIAADLSMIDDDILRSAAEDAVRIGHAIVVYADALPLDG